VSTYQDDAGLESWERRVDGWLRASLATNPSVLAVDRGEPGERRWFVRLRGEEKEITTVWLVLGQRTLRYETYVLPAPEENHAAFYEQLLRRNEGLVGCHFSIGVEDAIFLRGDLPVTALSEDELDRILGTLVATVERCFRALLRVAFASRFDPPPPAAG
jgi:hypothetical protein